MTDAAAAMQAKVREAIPITGGLDFNITRLDAQGIHSRAAFAPNVNIHGTAFAGSLYALGVVTAWTYATYLVEQAGLDADVVVANGEIRYVRPIASDIEGECAGGQAENELFIQTLEDGKRAKLNLAVSLNQDAAVLQALMVAIPK